MASMATLFNKIPTPTNPFSKTQKTHFVTRLEFPISGLSNSNFGKKGRRNPACRISCNLIEPDGGKLVDLVVPEGPARKGKMHKAALYPRIKLSRIDLEWVHVLSEGWAGPLRGFMRESEFLQTLHFNSLRLADGSVVNMSVPIVLAIDDSQKQAIGDQRRVLLVDSNNKQVAILSE